MSNFQPIDYVQMGAGWVAFLGAFIYVGWGWAGFAWALLAGAIVHLLFYVGRWIGGMPILPGVVS